jgi:outer membrane protein TolC
MNRFVFAVVFSLVAGPRLLAQDRPESPKSGQTLASLVAALDAANPEIKAAQREIDMRVARVQSAGAPPDPTLSVGFMGGYKQPPFFPSEATANGFRQLAISQELPFPGKLALRSQIAGTEAAAARWDLESTRWRLTSELKQMYFEYQLAARSLEIVRRNRVILDQYRQIAEARFSVGQAIQQDLLKAQLEISSLLERTVVLERQRDALRARINGLLYRPIDTPIDAELTYTEPLLPSSAESLRAEALARYPALRRGEQEITKGQQSLALARKELRPDFGINVAAQQAVPGMASMWGAEFMVKLPIFWQRKQRPMIAEAAAALEAGRNMRDNAAAEAEASVTEQYVTAASSRRLIDLYTGSVLPQARLTLESALASYQVGRADFLTVLTGFTGVLTYELNLEEQRAQYHQALARLEPLIGAELIK